MRQTNLLERSEKETVKKSLAKITIPGVTLCLPKTAASEEQYHILGETDFTKIGQPSHSTNKQTTTKTFLEGVERRIAVQNC